MLSQLNERHFPLSVTEMFLDRFCIVLTKMNIDEELPALLVEQTVLVVYVESPPVLDVGVLLRVHA